MAKNEKLHHRNFKISQKHHPPRWYFQVHQLSVHRGAVSLIQIAKMQTKRRLDHIKRQFLSYLFYRVLKKAVNLHIL